MHNVFLLKKLLSDELSLKNASQRATDRFSKNAGLGVVEAHAPTYQHDIESVFSRALTRRLAENSCDDLGACIE